MCLSEANGAKLATTVPTGPTVSHWNGLEWAQHNQTGPNSLANLGHISSEYNASSTQHYYQILENIPSKKYPPQNLKKR